MELKECKKLEHSQVEMTIAIDAASFSEAVGKAFQKNAKKFNVPGFRRGKAPRHLIEKMYGQDVFYYDAINDLFPDAFDQAAKEAKIVPVDRPSADVVSASLTDGAVVKVTVTVKPEVEIGEYKGLSVTKTIHTVKDADVDAEISRMQQRNARLITVDGAAEKDSIALIDYDGSIGGKPFEGGKAEKYSLTIGSNSFIPGFEDQIIGHKAGDEFDVKVTFPADYSAKEVAGKDAVFKVKLHEVHRRELPELNDDFAKDVSEFDTLDALKADIRKNDQESLDKNDTAQAENDLVDQVVAGMKAEIPDCMIESACDDMVRNFSYRLEQQGLTLENYLKYTGSDMKKFREGYRPQAEKEVKIRLALEKIVEQEKITASDEEFGAEVKKLADQYKMEEKKIRELVNEEQIKKDLAVNKAIDLIRESASITEVPESEKKADESEPKAGEKS